MEEQHNKRGAEIMATTSPSTAKNILLVTEEEIEVMRHWPIALRALFDPRADQELAERIEAERKAATDAAPPCDELSF